MTDHLFYHDSFLYDFEAEVTDIVPPLNAESRPAIILDRTAFYPTSGGQVFDTGSILPAGSDESGRLRVSEVAADDDGTILHYVESSGQLQKGTRVRGLIDAERRRDHMQQHSGQHVLSAAFVRLFQIPTVSFHMGADYCSIDLDTRTLTQQRIETAENLANEVVLENRPVDIRFVTQDEARELGLRKLPPAEREKLRLIDIRDFDLTACGGTHVTCTGQIGCILLRKAGKVRQGWRVEFVCGKRAVAAARRDYTTLAEGANLLSSHIWDVPQQMRKAQEELRASRKSGEQLLGEIAELHAARMLAETPENSGRKIITRVFPDRDLTFIKLLAQKITRQSTNAIVLLGATEGQAALVFAQSLGQPFDMGGLMKQALAQLGGRGGGSKDMAQGGPAQSEGIDAVLTELAKNLHHS